MFRVLTAGWTARVVQGVENNVLSFRTMLLGVRSQKGCLEQHWPQNPTASFKQETAALTQEMRGYGSTPGTKFTILWQQGWPEQKNALPRNWGRFKPSKVLSLWSSFTDFLPTAAHHLTVHFKDLCCGLILLLCVQRTVLMKSAAGTAGQTAWLPWLKVRPTKKNWKSVFHAWTCRCLAFSCCFKTAERYLQVLLLFLGSSMEHQHSTRVTEPAPRIGQGTNTTCTSVQADVLEKEDPYLF